MKTILKTVLAIGLVASSSLAVAEGRFVFREPLRGVDGQEYYGMSQSQVDDAIAEQERLAQIEADKAMCLNESTWMEEVTKTRYITETRYRTAYRTVKETRYRTAYRTVTEWVSAGSRFEADPFEDSYYVYKQSSGAKCYLWADNSLGCATSPYKVSGDYRYKSGTFQGTYTTGPRYTIIREQRATKEVPYQEEYTVNVQEPYQEAYTVQVPENYQTNVVKKSTNYDWCVNNGYQTAN